MAKNVQIPKAVDTKIYKTGQTRGADDDVIFQNRVSRNSTVLIPYKDYALCKKAPSNYGKYGKTTPSPPYQEIHNFLSKVGQLLLFVQIFTLKN